MENVILNCDGWKDFQDLPQGQGGLTVKEMKQKVKDAGPVEWICFEYSPGRFEGIVMFSFKFENYGKRFYEYMGTAS